MGEGGAANGLGRHDEAMVAAGEAAEHPYGPGLVHWSLSELAATGEAVARRAEPTRDVLTPQEAQIARLAADGRTNPEIGAQLFISPRTVEYHLHKLYGKLGVSSRNALRGALGTPAGVS